MLGFVSFACLLLNGADGLAQGPSATPNPKPAVIPPLREWTGGTGRLTISSQTRIIVDSDDGPSLLPVAKTLQADLREVAGIAPAIAVGKSPGAGDIELRFVRAIGQRGAEAYRLDAADRVRIEGAAPKGVFYGTRTLLQMLVLDPQRRSIPRGEAFDWPDYAERGFMLDVGRKFFAIQYLRQYVKFMAWYKLNDFQLHLNDGAANDYSGFRLQSDAFPGLANADGAYTRKQMDDLQDLAAEYHVTITPEFDAPAHSRAFTKYKPELIGKNLSPDHLDLANPKSQEFINSLWKEFIPWFRADAVHIGADEYNAGPGSAALYKRYINETAAFVRSQGKKVRMWGGLKTAGDSSGVDRDIVVNLWYPGYHDPLDAVADGYKIINTHDGYVYIVPFAGYYNHFLNTRYLYSAWKPTVFGDQKLPDYDPRVLGGMFAVWNDKAAYPYVFEDVHELVKPAMPTLGEVLWAGHPEGARTYDQFEADFRKLGDGPGVRIAPPPARKNRGDLAFGQKGDSSAGQTGVYGVQTLFDGRAPSRWIADPNTQPWASVDLGGVKTVSRVILRWAPDSHAKSYAVSVSADGTNWSEAYRTDQGKGGVETARFAAAPARYVKLQCFERGGSEGNVSLFALEVYR